MVRARKGDPLVVTLAESFGGIKGNLLYQPAVIGTHFTGIILAQGKARFAP